MSQAYDFQERLTAGQKGEATLDRFFATWYAIRPATRAEQRSGIDRIFTRRTDGQIAAVEYKTDWAAHRTGNAFIETVSVDSANKPGWAFSSKAAILVYYVIDDDLAYIVTFATLREHLLRWQRAYPTRSIPNKGYHTVGLLVPLYELEHIALEVIVVPE